MVYFLPSIGFYQGSIKYFFYSNRAYPSPNVRSSYDNYFKTSQSWLDFTGCKTRLVYDLRALRDSEGVRRRSWRIKCVWRALLIVKKFVLTDHKISHSQYRLIICHSCQNGTCYTILFCENTKSPNGPCTPLESHREDAYYSDEY